MILVELRIHGVDLALTEGVVEGVVDGGGRDSEARGGGAVDDERCGRTAELLVGYDVGQLRKFLQARHEVAGHGVELVLVRILERVLILGAADPVIDREVLYRLHVQLDAFHLLELGTEAIDDRSRREAAIFKGLQIDLDAAAVQRGIGAVGSDKRGDTFNRGIGEQDLGERLLLLRHLLERDGGRGLGDPLDDACILRGEEAFRHRDVEDDGEDQGSDRDEERDGLEAQHEAQRPPVKGDDVVEDLLRLVVEPALLVGRRVLQQAGRHHRREGERDEGRDDNRNGEGYSELAEEPTGDIAHEEQGDEHGDERDGERQDGEADLLGALKRRIHGLVTLLDVTRDVLDHDDGVVDYEAGGDGERHHGEVVEAVAGQIHDAEGADERDGHGDAGDDGRGEVPQEEEDDHDHQADGQHQFELNVFDGGADGGGAVGDDLDVDGLGKRRFELGQQLLDAVDDLDGVGSGLPLDVEDDGGRVVHPGGELRVLHPVDDMGDLVEHDRRTVAIGDDDGSVVSTGEQLVVGVDGVILRGAVEVALCRVEAVAGEGVAQVFEIDSVGGEGGGVGLDPDGGLLTAGDADQADAGDLRDLGRETGVGEVFDLAQGHLAGGEREGEDGGVGGVRLAVDGRRGQVGGEVALGRVDGRLHLLLSDIDVEAELELHDDDGDAAGAGGGHLAEAGDLTELPFERRCHA